jgi:hypothetical protein
VCLDPTITEIYVGSTTNFNERKRQHKGYIVDKVGKGYDLKVYKFIRANGEWANWTMELIEYYPTDDKLKLLKREGELIRELNATLNINIPGRTNAEYREDNRKLLVEKSRQYAIDNIDKVKAYRKEYYDENKDISSAQNKIHYENNKDAIKERTTQWANENIDKVREYKKAYGKKESTLEHRKAKMTCECGAIICNGAKWNHYKSPKHINYIQSLANVKV